MVNMIVNVGLWYSKHAAKLAAQSEFVFAFNVYFRSLLTVKFILKQLH